MGIVSKNVDSIYQRRNKYKEGEHTFSSADVVKYILPSTARFRLVDECIPTLNSLIPINLLRFSQLSTRGAVLSFSILFAPSVVAGTAAGRVPRIAPKVLLKVIPAPTPA